MTVEQLAATVLDACEQAGVDHMLTGAFAHGLYGIPRSTKDVDVVISLASGDPIQEVDILSRLEQALASIPPLE